MYTKELKWTDDEIELVKKHYKSMTYDELSKLINKSPRAIGTKAQRLGLIKQPQSRYNINQNCFDTLDKDIAYILGFIITDGCVSNNRLEIHIQRSDRYLLENIRDKLDPQIPVLDHEFYNKQLQHQIYSSRLLLNSKYICEKLSDYGIIPRKTGYQHVTNIPAKYKYHYLRGVFDGNGCIAGKNNTYNYLSISIVNFNIEFLEELREFTFPRFGYIKIKKNHNSKIAVWYINKQQHVKEFYQKIYYNCGNLFLNRKRQIFESKF